MDDMFTSNREPMLDMFIFETTQLLEQLEEILLESEKSNKISEENINEIFRIMHTTKGSSAMMMFNNISTVAHRIEDLFFYIRENRGAKIDYAHVCDFVLEASDFIKSEVGKLEVGEEPDGSENDLLLKIDKFLTELKGTAEAGESRTKAASEQKKTAPKRYYISSYNKPLKKVEEEVPKRSKFHMKVLFEEGSQMENIRAYTIVNNLSDDCSELYHRPKDILEDPNSTDYIVKYGFEMYFETGKSEHEIIEIMNSALFISKYELIELDDYEDEISDLKVKVAESLAHDNEIVLPETIIPLNEELPEATERESNSKSVKQNLISVNISKLDKLMDLVGEIVISEAMVTRNPELAGLELDGFNKAARQLRKLTDELQDIVMSIRMIPIAATFHKMHRIVRDMNKKLGKNANLVIMGEETEVDKNIIDNLSDPMMHLIRNAMDHGIEGLDERVKKGKSDASQIVLEAKNTGGDVVITIKDDGRGLDRNKILEKARANGLVSKPEHELTDKDIFSFILLPGFSTKEQVTEFSGRGVGMDVVKKNIEKVGGHVNVDSEFGVSTTITIKIPLTLAIIDGMQIGVGKSVYTIPIVSIKESFRPANGSVIIDPDGNEMTLIRGECVPIVRLHDYFGINTDVRSFEDGILVVVENENNMLCLFADMLIGEQQAVVKPLPNYISKYVGNISGVGGCTILGDGSISLIVDVNSIVSDIG